MALSSGFLKTATVAALVAAGSLTLAPEAMAFGGGGFHGGGFHGGGFGGGGWHGGGGWRGGGWGGGGWRGAGWRGGGWGGGWGPGWGLGAAGLGLGLAAASAWPYDDGYYGWNDGYGYPSCTLRRVAVRTAWGVRWRTIQYC
jgi:hypothetical protein